MSDAKLLRDTGVNVYAPANPHISLLDPHSGAVIAQFGESNILCQGQPRRIHAEIPGLSVAPVTFSVAIQR